jgi:uncharacterized protein (TIGR00369 family)
MTDSTTAFPGSRDEYAGNFVDWLGLEFVEMTGDRVECTWRVEPRMHQPYGILHGGIHCSVVETLASLGGAMWVGEKAKVVGVNNNTDFYKAVSEGAMTSVALPVHRGRSQQVWAVETVADDTGKTVARGQVRLQNLYPDS